MGIGFNQMVTTKTITREKIAHILKSKLGLSSIICEEIVDQIFKNIQQMASNQRLTLAGFGSFCTSTKKPRPGINFHTKEIVIIPEKEVMRFIPAKKLKLLINSPYV